MLDIPILASRPRLEISTTTQWCGPLHVTVRHGVGKRERVRSRAHYAVRESHPYESDTVDQCRAFRDSGSVSNGVKIQAKNVRLINPVAKYSGNEASAWTPSLPRMPRNPRHEPSGLLLWARQLVGNVPMDPQHAFSYRDAHE